MTNDKLANNRNMVMQNLAELSPSDSQIIDMLLLLLDDWQIRLSVTQCVQKRQIAAVQSGATNAQTITQNVDLRNSDDDHERDKNRQKERDT